MDQRSITWRAMLLFATLCNATLMSQGNGSTECRCFPGEVCWPSATQWDAFNHTVGGKLIRNVPLASACRKDGNYDAEACENLRSTWLYPETHLSSIGSTMAPLFTNDSCNIFAPDDAPCTLGGLVSFAVNATCTADFQKTVAFVRRHNIRLVVRNTGHDYNGKSTGAGALAIWTHYLKTQEVVDYQSPSYTGKAVKLGAGVEIAESYAFAQQHGFVNVGGDCPTVGVAGGYTQGGGGHGPGVSKFGLGADQALEWEVVTGTGEVLIANREKNQDLHWALAGGGGGTYGIVSSLTIKVYPDVKSSAASLSFASKGNDDDAFWDVVHIWQASLPSISRSGCFAIWVISPSGFELVPANCPGLSKNDTRKLFEPTLKSLEQSNIQYNFTLDEFPNFYDSYKEHNMMFPKNVSQSQLGSRLIPKDIVARNNTELVKIFRHVVSLGNDFLGTAVDVLQHANVTEHTSVAPHRRQAAFSAIFGTNYDQKNYGVNIARANEMTDKLLPMLEGITPNGSAYMNECDFQQPNFQQVLYGVNYDALLKIEDKYDPDQIFYAITAVGSERWYSNEEQGGRLCPVSTV